LLISKRTVLKCLIVVEEHCTRELVSLLDLKVVRWIAGEDKLDIGQGQWLDELRRERGAISMVISFLP